MPGRYIQPVRDGALWDQFSAKESEQRAKGLGSNPQDLSFSSMPITGILKSLWECGACYRMLGRQCRQPGADAGVRIDEGRLPSGVSRVSKFCSHT
jgi:hypothetical protein